MYRQERRHNTSLDRTSEFKLGTGVAYECGSVEEINQHFASIATDLDYNKDSIISELNRYISGPTSTAAAEACYSPDFIAVALSHVRKTSTGSDCIPCWVFKECASELCEIISVLINFSINEGCVPSVWKHAVITPVPKVQPATSVTDFRPISVTPVFFSIY